ARNDVIRLSEDARGRFVRAVEPVLQKYRRQLDPKLFAYLGSGGNAPRCGAATSARSARRQLVAVGPHDEVLLSRRHLDVDRLGIERGATEEQEDECGGRQCARQ